MKKILSLFVIATISISAYSQLSFDKVKHELKTGSFLTFSSGDEGSYTIQSKVFNDDITKKRRKSKKRRGKGRSKSFPLGYGFHVGGGLFSAAGDAVDFFGKENVKSHFGPVAGVDVIYLFSDMFGVRSGIGLTQKGYAVKYSSSFDVFGISTTTDVDASDAYNYLSVPLLGYAAFGEGIRFFANVGPVFNVWMSGKSKSTTTSTVTGMDPVTESTDDKITDGMESLEISLLAGAGVLYTLVEGKRSPSISVSAEAGYNMGLTDIITDVKHKSSGL